MGGDRTKGRVKKEGKEMLKEEERRGVKLLMRRLSIVNDFF